MLKKILVIDDDPAILEVIELLLQSEGYSVIKAIDGEIGINKAKKNKPDGIILDVMMPKMSGYMVATLLSQDEMLKNVPIMLLTAAAPMAGGITLKSPTPYRIAKPFKPDQLTEMLGKMLDKYRGNCI